MFTKPGVWGALFFAFSTAVAHAEVTTYDCRFTTGSVRDLNWIPSVLMLRHDRATDKIVVFDPIIKHFVGTPVSARLVDETARRITFGWSVDIRRLPGAAGAADMTYRLSYYRSGRPARMTAVPSGFDNDFSGDGTCTLRKG
jgi:hypothetical protein